MDTFRTELEVGPPILKSLVLGMQIQVVYHVGYRVCCRRDSRIERRMRD